METIKIIISCAGSIVLAAVILNYIILRIQFFLFEREVLLNPGFSEAFVSLVKAYTRYQYFSSLKYGLFKLYRKYWTSSKYLNLTKDIYSQMILLLESEYNWESFSNSFKFIYTKIGYYDDKERQLRFQNEWANATDFILKIHEINKSINKKAYNLLSSHLLSLVNTQKNNLYDLEYLIKLVLSDIKLHEYYPVSEDDIKKFYIYHENKIIHKTQTYFKLSRDSSDDPADCLRICNQYLEYRVFIYCNHNSHQELRTLISKTRDDALLSMIEKSNDEKEKRELADKLTNKSRIVVSTITN
ncbi:MAG: hypothetical protein RL687_311 [Candidatus Parcubacteria bacterium]|jgi:hypothetical protein